MWRHISIAVRSVLLASVGDCRVLAGAEHLHRVALEVQWGKAAGGLPDADGVDLDTEEGQNSQE